jgi:flagellar basal body rod protein FlgG
MLISNGIPRVLDDIAARERDALGAYAPGAMPERGDVAKLATSVPTFDALSVAPPADAYFITRDEGDRMLFTRDGSLCMKDGTLVDPQGRPVLGFSRPRAVLAPLKVDPVDVALGFSGTARIEADGSVTYQRTTVDPRTGLRESQRASIGRLALARFAPGTKLQPTDLQHAYAPPGVAAHIGCSGDGNFGALTPFARESSGIDIDRSLQHLQEAYLALDAIRASVSAERGVEKTTMDLLK